MTATNLQYTALLDPTMPPSRLARREGFIPQSPRAVDVFAFAKYLGVDVRFNDEKLIPSNALAYTTLEANRPVIRVRASKLNAAWRRFVVAHEISHIHNDVLKRGWEKGFTFKLDRQPETSGLWAGIRSWFKPGIEESELEADYQARELLYPEPWVDQLAGLSNAEISRLLEIPLQEVENRHLVDFP